MTISLHIHDLVELFIAFSCFAFFLFVLAGATRASEGPRYLAALFFCVGIVSVCVLCFWTPFFKPKNILLSQLVASLFVFASIAKGVSLFLYVRGIAEGEFKFTQPEKRVLIAALVASILLFALGLSIENLTKQIEQISFWEFALELLLTAVPLFYACRCLGLLSQASQSLQQYYSNVSEIACRWLYLLVYGFVFVWAWWMFSHLAGGYIGLYIHEALPNFIGLFARYVKFVLVVGVYLFSISQALQLLRKALSVQDEIKQVPSESETDKPVTSFDLTIAKVEHGMLREELFLEKNLNLERFANRVGADIREVSLVINNHFNCNFFEFVNRHRVDKAKGLLQTNDEKSINEIMKESGFSSKSSFHRVFKLATGFSPGQFRDQAQAEKAREEKVECVSAH